LANEALSKSVADYVRLLVAGGFEEPDEIVSIVVESFEDEDGADELPALVERLTDEAIQAHLEAQKSWPEVTDCDRLDNALDELTGAGIVCRQHFQDDGADAEGCIGAEMRAEAKYVKVRGYAFYATPETTKAVEHGTLRIDYGAVAKGKAALVAVGREIVETLRRHGLTTAWNGRGDTALQVRLDWKRRREPPDGDVIQPGNSW
jgi:hypothetical protein